MTSCTSSSLRDIRPGPDNPSLLRFQSVHVSEHIWNGAPNRLLKVRRAKHFHEHGNIPHIPHQIISHLRRAGFLGLAQLQFFQSEPDLISALVERWRPETHTFHMPPGECTITLQDVAVLTGLPINGMAVIGSTSARVWEPIVVHLLGISPPESELHGASVKMSWLLQHFSNVEDHVHDEIQLGRFARAFILRLIGGVVFCDHSSSRVSLRYLPLLADLDQCGQYSWGSAALAYLYRELCMVTDYDKKEICGFTLLLQLWAWERFPLIAPTTPVIIDYSHPYGARWRRRSFKAVRQDMRFYRHAFERMKQSHIVWEPYREVISLLPNICRDGVECWRAVVPLVCFQIIEWHQPDRVMRQFGMAQHIPHPPSQQDNVHGVTLKGKTDDNWLHVYVEYIDLWNNRVQYVWSGEPHDGVLSVNSEYMRWYTRHTRRWITREYAVRGRVVDQLEIIHYLSSEVAQSSTLPPSLVLEQIRHIAENILVMYEEEDRVVEARIPAPIPTREGPHEVVQAKMPEHRVERQGLQHRRRRVEHEQLTIQSFPPRSEGEYFVPTHDVPPSPIPTYFHPS